MTGKEILQRLGYDNSSTTANEYMIAKDAYDLALNDTIEQIKQIQFNKLQLPKTLDVNSAPLHECPVCSQIAGKTYLAAKLPTICQKCDHFWFRA